MPQPDAHVELVLGGCFTTEAPRHPVGARVYTQLAEARLGHLHTPALSLQMQERDAIWGIPGLLPTWPLRWAESTGKNRDLKGSGAYGHVSHMACLSRFQGFFVSFLGRFTRERRVIRNLPRPCLDRLYLSRFLARADRDATAATKAKTVADMVAETSSGPPGGDTPPSQNDHSGRSNSRCVHAACPRCKRSYGTDWEEILCTFDRDLDATRSAVGDSTGASKFSTSRARRPAQRPSAPSS